jgi:hypothetical protein
MSEFETKLTQALERRPEVAVPEGFAARVAAALPLQKPRRRAVHVGRTAAIAGAMVLALTMFAVAPHSEPSFANLFFDAELLMLAQLAGIAWWFGKAVSSKQ